MGHAAEGRADDHGGVRMLLILMCVSLAMPSLSAGNSSGSAQKGLGLVRGRIHQIQGRAAAAGLLHVEKWKVMPPSLAPTLDERTHDVNFSTPVMPVRLP